MAVYAFSCRPDMGMRIRIEILWDACNMAEKLRLPMFTLPMERTLNTALANFWKMVSQNG